MLTLSAYFPNELEIKAIAKPLLPYFANLYKFPAGVQLYELLKEFTYNSPKYGTIVVPAGFVTDFGSVPATAHWYVDDEDPDILYGAIIHDHLYNRQGKIEGKTLSRKESDEVLREAMLCVNAPKRKAAVVYWSVRLLGNSAWKS